MSEPQNLDSTDKSAMRQRLRRIRNGIRITKITCTRSVKGRTGDSFVGFSAAWQSIQDDHSGPGADVMADPEDDRAYAEQGLTLKDAKLARYMLSMECDIAALESGLANGTITPSYFSDTVRGVKNNYEQLILREMGLMPNGDGKENPDGGSDDRK
jgi:hypothetical protein